VLAATNRSLPDEIAARRFRLDLFYRLSAFEITTPPVRARREDIPLLAEPFLKFACAELDCKRALSFSQAALDLLACQRWTGNVRQLQHVVEIASVGEESKSVEALLADSDRALYVAKREGRNRTGAHCRGKASGGM
jgi:DNA-binding NtrC family response regulator